MELEHLKTLNSAVGAKYILDPMLDNKLARLSHQTQFISLLRDRDRYKLFLLKWLTWAEGEATGKLLAQNVQSHMDNAHFPALKMKTGYFSGFLSIVLFKGAVHIYGITYLFTWHSTTCVARCWPKSAQYFYHAAGVKEGDCYVSQP